MGWDLTEIVETNIQYTEIVETNIQYTEKM